MMQPVGQPEPLVVNFIRQKDPDGIIGLGLAGRRKQLAASPAASVWMRTVLGVSGMLIAIIQLFALT